MYVAIMKIELLFPPVASIKEKRKIINRVKMRLFSRFKIPLAEVEDQDLYNSSVLGLSFVSLKHNHADSRCQKIIHFLEENESDIFHDYNKLIEEY